MKTYLASLDDAFLVTEWGRILQQIEMTLNMLQASQFNQKLLAYAYIPGQFDYNQMSLVPPGTRVVVHKKPVARSIWAFNGEYGWTIGPEMEQYIHIKHYSPKTKSERNVDTVTFSPKGECTPRWV